MLLYINLVFNIVNLLLLGIPNSKFYIIWKQGSNQLLNLSAHARVVYSSHFISLSVCLSVCLSVAYLIHGDF